MSNPIADVTRAVAGLAAEGLDRAGKVLNAGLLREIAFSLDVAISREDTPAHTLPVREDRVA
jgi:hypothetical protein